MSGELLGVDRGRGDDQMKVVATFDESPQVTEQEVDVERPFVGFVDDDRVVPAQIRVALEFGEEDAVGHRLHQRAIADFVGETHRVANEVTDFGTEFVRHPGGDRAAARRRGWVWPIMAPTPRPSSRQNFGIWVDLPSPSLRRSRRPDSPGSCRGVPGAARRSVAGPDRRSRARWRGAAREISTHGVNRRQE